MKILLIAVVLILSLAGCATTEIPPVPTEAKVAVGVPCITREQVPLKPGFVTDAQLQAKSDELLVIALRSDQLSRREYEGKLEAVIEACVGGLPTTAPVSAPSDKPWWKIW